jgi:hypothetical protein
MARTERAHSDGAILPSRNSFLLMSRHNQNHEMVDTAASVRCASYRCSSVLLQQRYATEVPLYRNGHYRQVVGHTGKGGNLSMMICEPILSQHTE